MSVSKPDVAPYTNVENGTTGPAIVKVSVSLTVLATAFLLLRVYARLIVLGHRKPGWSLSFAIIAWAFGVPASILWALSTQHGFGSDFILVKTRPDLQTGMIYEWVGAALSLFAAWFGKASALAYVLDVQGPIYRRRKWIMVGIVAINLILYIILVPIFFLQCNPPNKLFDYSSNQDCRQGPRTFIVATVTGAWGAFTDVALALYPTTLLWALQMKVQLKAGLCVLMGLGVFTAACAVLKTLLFCGFQATVFDDNPTYDNAGFVFWSIIEMWVILITGCIPTLWPLARRITRSARDTLTNSWPSYKKSGGVSSGESGSDGSGGETKSGVQFSYSQHDVDIYGSNGVDGRPNSSPGRSAAKRYFYEYRCTDREHQAQRVKRSPFGEWGMLASGARSEEDLTVEDGIRVTRDLSISSTPAVVNKSNQEADERPRANDA